MKTNTIHIFVAGGGSAEDSKLLDKRFVKIIDRTKPLVYIPNAMETLSYQKCLEWFQSVMTPFGVTNIEMWDDLQPRYPTVTSIAGVYIGGGNTLKLRKELLNFGFTDYLRKAIGAGIPLYGGSAGAIILGEDIRTAPEARNLAISETAGLKIIPGYSIACHYNDAEKATMQQLVKTLNCDIVAVPEKAGGYLSGEAITSYGTKPLIIFRKNEIVYLNPDHSIPLFLQK